MKLIFTLLFILQIPVYFGQNIWFANATSDATSESMDVVLDDDGNSYITGYISGDTEFQNIQIDINLGYSDVIVAKINSLGVYQWVKRFNGPLSDKGIKIDLTSSNEIVITGTYYNSINFGGTILNSVNNSKDIFLTKLSNSGDVIWAKSMGGALGDNPYGLVVDNADNVILTGQYEGSATIGGQVFTSMIDPNTNLPSFEMFLCKYDSNGIPIWAKAAHAPYEDRGLSVACDVQNNIYMTGQFSDTIDFFGRTIYNQIYNAGFISKFGPDGSELWFDKLAAAQVLAYDITVDSQNKILVTGDFLGQLVVWAQEGQYIITNPYDKKIFVLKLDNQGNYQWGKAKGSNSEVSSRTICTDVENNIYIGGHFKCNFDEFRDSTGTAHWQSVGFRDQFVTKFNPNGTTDWKNQVGGQKEDRIWGIAIKDVNYPIITGSYATNIIFPFESQYDYYSNISNLNVQNLLYISPIDFVNDDVNYCLINGDESINIHVAKMVSNRSNYYNYYRQNSTQSYNDSIPMFITPNQDSVDFCPPDRACVRTNTDNLYGPLYEGLWNNNTLWNICVDNNNQDGLYSVFVDRQDHCYNFSDAIYIDYHPIPQMPFLTDDYNININTQNYQDVYACAPDTLNFSFQNLCEGCSANIKIESLSLDVALILDSSYQTDLESQIEISVTSEHGCSRSRNFKYSLFYEIKPFLILDDSYDRNDSIMVCLNRAVKVIVSDSISNFNFNLVSHDEVVNIAHYTISHNGSSITEQYNGHFISIYAHESGWYSIDQTLEVGIGTCVESFNLSDSFYIEVQENPTISFIVGDLLCPDTYNYLSVTPVIPNLQWNGPGILWTSADNDSIKLNESGIYNISGAYDYGEITCPLFRSLLIEEKEPPLIILNPIDGVLCPYDSIKLSLSQTGMSYEWIGPEGNVLSTDASIYVENQGFYTCIFTDNTGCQLLTAQAEVKEYTTPFLELSPSNVICSAETITLSAIHGGLANVFWHQPINSNAESIQVNQVGTYICSVSQCGITVIDSVTIIDGSYQLNISAENTNLCFGDTIQITTNPGLSSYIWSNGFVGNNFLQVYESGSYSVETFNQYGCIQNSDTIQISISSASIPPAINDTFVCMGQNISLNYQSDFTFGWYNSTSDLIPFSTQNIISFSNVNTGFSVFIAHDSPNCPLNFTEVFVEVLAPLTPPEIFGDSTICPNENVNFSVNPISNGNYFWVYDGDTLSTSTTLNIENITELNPTLVQIFVNDGCTTNQNQLTFELKFPSALTLDNIADTLCYGENLLVNATGNISYFWTDGVSTWTGQTLNLSYFDIASNQISVYGINVDDCHSDTLIIEISLSPDVNLNIQVDSIICLNSEIIVTADIQSSPLSWQYPNGQVITAQHLIFDVIQYSDQGAYIAQFINNYNCLIADTVNISVKDLPKFSHIRDSILCSEDVYNISFPAENYTYFWNNISAENNFVPDGESPILLIAIDSIGCYFEDTIQITLVDCSGKAANIITANNDGINDYFTVFNSEYSFDNCLIILNRWGNVVYEKNYYRNDFNGYTNEGTKLSDGAYFFLYYKDCSRKREITHQGYLQIVSE